MADPRFFSVKGPFTVAELAEVGAASLHDPEQSKTVIGDVAPLETAGPDHISFFDNVRYLETFHRTKAGACLMHPRHLDQAPRNTVLLLADNPYLAYALVARAFYPQEAAEGAISPNAVIDETAAIGEGTSIHPGAVIGAHVEIGQRCLIGANVVISSGVVIGDDCRVGECASLSHCLIGSRVRLFAGVRIGEDGFGFAPGGAVPVNIPQLGRVIIEDDVEIAANSTVDRGAGPDTVIGRGCRIDNLVQIGHNVQLGRGCIVVAQVGISGSTRIGDNVVIGGQAGVAGHLTIGDGARIGAQAGLVRDVPAGTSVWGTPALPLRQSIRQSKIMARLAQKKTGKNG